MSGIKINIILYVYRTKLPRLFVYSFCCQLLCKKITSQNWSSCQFVTNGGVIKQLNDLYNFLDCSKNPSATFQNPTDQSGSRMKWTQPIGCLHFNYSMSTLRNQRELSRHALHHRPEQISVYGKYKTMILQTYCCNITCKNTEKKTKTTCHFTLVVKKKIQLLTNYKLIFQIVYLIRP